ncbi:MAG TPA: DegT/DnrJ/EryC1/StrS family aminotransferase [Gemmatimonadaceae bacterium]|nr:DegT/DnrJ/EryC1/StrS family aminotransferase [Gemmatimonadaceae bacterium]
MSLRQQLPVHSPITLAGLSRAAVAAAIGPRARLREVAGTLRKAYATPRVLLTDSGTSALVLALRLAVGKGNAVAIPGYACFDVAAAVRFAKTKARIYDVDPNTLSPDLDSLDAALRRGVSAVLVAHLYGYPVDLYGVLELARRYGVPVVEDAAQGIGATYDGHPLGTFGALSVLSFGRGKGVTGGRGGALLVNDDRFDGAAADAATVLGTPRHGWSELFVSTAQWILGRPWAYGVPSRIPWLHLGETVYHAAHEPRSMSVVAATLVQRAPEQSAQRRRVADVLARAVEEGGAVGAVAVVDKARPGYLRYAIIDSGLRSPRPDLGVLRGYPKNLADLESLRPSLVGGDDPTPGVARLTRALFTVPTHALVRSSDLEQIIEWLRIPARLVVDPSARSRSLDAAER